MYLVFSGLSLVCTAYMSIMFGVGANAHLFLSLTFSVSNLDLACGGLCSLTIYIVVVLARMCLLL